MIFVIWENNNSGKCMGTQLINTKYLDFYVFFFFKQILFFVFKDDLKLLK